MRFLISLIFSIACGPVHAKSMVTIYPQPPTFHSFSPSSTQTGWLFNISTSSTFSVGDVYKENNGAGNSYTVVSAGSGVTGNVFWATGSTSAPTTPLVKQSGNAGSTSSISFTAQQKMQTYAQPASKPLYVKVWAWGGGAGGTGSGTAAGTAPNAGATSYICCTAAGLQIASYGGGSIGVWNSSGGAGGSASNPSGSYPATVFGNTSGQAGQIGMQSVTASVTAVGGAGGGSAFYPGSAGGTNNALMWGTGGAGPSTGGSAGPMVGGSGGGSGAFGSFIIQKAFLVWPIYTSVGARGTGGGLGTGGSGGFAGQDGQIFFEELYQ